jgi:putative DNA primase/helicase
MTAFTWPGSTINRAKGRWREILPQLGIESSFLKANKNDHGPCPICGGKDRFRFEDRDGSGNYFCGKCPERRAGYALHLLMGKHGWTWAEACRAVDGILEDEPSAPGNQPRENTRRDDTARCHLREIERTLEGARSRKIVDEYLRSRGCSEGSDVLLGHPGLWHSEAGRQVPAVVCPIHGPDGSLQSAMRIFIGDVEPRKKFMPPVSTIRGAAVRLHDVGDEMAVGEGIETCLAAHELSGISVWAALSAIGIMTFEPPPGVRRLHIFADNDSHSVGQDAARALARRLIGSGLAIEIHIPPNPDTDWNDVLRATRGVCA